MPLASLASICLLRQYASCLCAFGIDMPLASLAPICLMSCYISCASLLHLLRFSITSRASPLHLALFHSTSRALSKSFYFLHWRIFYFSCLLRAQLCQSTASYASGLAQMSQDNSDNCCCAMADHMLHTCSSPFCPIGAHIMVAVPF